MHGATSLRWLTAFAILSTSFSILWPCGVAQGVILYGTAAANTPFPNGRILVIDYDAGTVLQTFNGPSGVTIGDTVTGAGFRTSTGTLYIVDGFGTNTIFQVNPATGAVISSFPSPTGNTSLDGLEFLGDVLNGLIVANGAIIRINPDTGASLGQLANAPGGTVIGGLAGFGNTLFSRGTANTTILTRSATDGSTTNSFPSPNGEVVQGLATNGASLFASTTAGNIYRLNPATGAILDSRSFSIAIDGLAGVVPEPSGALLIIMSLSLACLCRR